MVNERFWSKVNKSSGCWLWTASTQTGGYGQFSVLDARGHYVPRRAHRVSWELAFGQVPDGLCVLHRCDVRTCVNPDHLFLGTRADNTADMVTKKRQKRGLRGEDVLTAEEVGAMRELRMRGRSAREIAEAYGVGEKTAWAIVTGRSWRHLPMPQVA